jgi:dynein heavy chain 1
LESALFRILKKCEEHEVKVTLEIINQHPHFFPQHIDFHASTRLKQMYSDLHNANKQVTKDFPVNVLLQAKVFEDISSAIRSIFRHLSEHRVMHYPAVRVLRLLKHVFADLSSQLLKLLGTHRLMFIPFVEFTEIVNKCFNVFEIWDSHHKMFRAKMLDIVMKFSSTINEKMVNGRSFVPVVHSDIIWYPRMEEVKEFRRKHEQLCSAIGRLLPPVSSIDILNEVILGYENVKMLDGLDISKEGTEAWEAALRRYEECIDRVETRIIAGLREILGTAKNANEMFRIFSRFNGLIVRPHILGAIRDYQTQFIQFTKNDIVTLHDKFKVLFLSTIPLLNIQSITLLLILVYINCCIGSIFSQ